MFLVRIPVLLNMLACKSRMIPHVTICTVDAWIFAVLVNVKRIADPLDVELLLLRRQLSVLLYWAWKRRVWEQVLETGIDLIEYAPVKTFLFWIGALRDVNRNRMATLGRSLGRSGAPLG